MKEIIKKNSTRKIVKVFQKLVLKMPHPATVKPANKNMNKAVLFLMCAFLDFYLLRCFKAGLWLFRYRLCNRKFSESILSKSAGTTAYVAAERKQVRLFSELKMY